MRELGSLVPIGGSIPYPARHLADYNDLHEEL